MGNDAYARAAEFAEVPVYYPEVRPGYAAWVVFFDFGNGDLGLCFNEIRKRKNPDFRPYSLEFKEAMNAPYMFGCTVGNAHPDFTNEYVYMKSVDGGRTWEQTGRCVVCGRHLWHVGFPDGRMIRIHGTRDATPLEFSVVVEESGDGGNTWKEISRLQEGYNTVMMKAKRLRDGSVVFCGPICPAFGPDLAKDTRQTLPPGELYPHEAAFYVSSDEGRTWDGPHYVLPGILAWEFDFVELPDGSLLFINSAVQSGRPVRQIAKKTATGYINEPLTVIRRGGEWGPEDLEGGFVPETVCITPEGLLVGALRGKPYSCSADLGENWFEIAGLPPSRYQPMILQAGDGRILNAWHNGYDAHFGEVDMFIGIHEFRLDASLPKSTRLTLKRRLRPDGNKFINAYDAKLTAGGRPVADREIELRLLPVWTPEGKHEPRDVREAGELRRAVTDAEGVARFELTELDRIPDVHFAYRLAASFSPKSGDELAPCLGPERMAYAMTSERNRPAAYPVYMTHGWIMITPETRERFPELADVVAKFDGRNPDAPAETWIEAVRDEARAREILDFLVQNGLLILGADGVYRWYRCVHCFEEIVKGVRVCEGTEHYV